MKTSLRFPILLLIVSTVLASCSRADDFVGNYSTNPSGKPELAISTKSGKFYVSLFDAGKWSTPEEVSPVADKDIRELFGEDAKIVRASLGRESFAIFRVSKGASIKDLGVLPSNYLMMFAVPRPLYKVP